MKIAFNADGPNWLNRDSFMTWFNEKKEEDSLWPSNAKLAGLRGYTTFPWRNCHKNIVSHLPQGFHRTMDLSGKICASGQSTSDPFHLQICWITLVVGWSSFLDSPPTRETLFPTRQIYGSPPGGQWGWRGYESEWWLGRMWNTKGKNSIASRIELELNINSHCSLIYCITAHCITTNTSI